LEARSLRFSKAWKIPAAVSHALETRGLAALALALGAAAAPVRGAPAAEATVIVLPVKNAATHAIIRGRLDETDPVVRAEALDALARIGDPADRAAIHGRLDDGDPRVRAEALRALARRGESADEAALVRLAGDGSAVVRRAVFDHAPDAFFERRPDLVAAGLAETDPAVRAAAARRAAVLDESPDALRQRIAAESDPAVRARLLCAFAGRNDGVRPIVLRAALEGDDRVLRQTALECLTPDDAAFAATALALAERERGAVAAAALGAVARLRPAGGAVTLIRRLDVERDPALWPPLCAALGVFDGDPAVVAALAGELRRRRGFSAQSAAAQALAGLTTPGIAAATAAGAGNGDPRVRVLVARILGGRREPASGATLWKMLDDAEASVLIAALEALHRLGSPREGARLDRVRALDSHEHPDVVAGAIRVRGDLGDREMIPALVQRLRRVRIDIPSSPRAAALDALIALGHGGEVRRAVELVAKNVVPPSQMNPEPIPDDPAVRRAALRYLERFGDAAAAERMLASFDEVPIPELRPDIARTASRLTGRRYRALPNYQHLIYSVESLDEPSHPPWPPNPGVAPE